MSGFSESRDVDLRYRKRLFNDSPVAPDINQSIRELRVIYKEMNDLAFAAFYSKRYKVPAAQVLRVLHRTGTDHGEK